MSARRLELQAKRLMPMRNVNNSARRALPSAGIVLLVACAADSDGARGPGIEQGDAASAQVPPTGAADASGPVAPPVSDSGGLPPVSTGATDAGVSRPDASNVCASVRVAANRITPQVMLLIDGSGSMVEPLGEISRWGALRDALFSQAGVVRELEGTVQFGMTVYSTPIPMRGMPLGMCPSLIHVPPALNNLAAIMAAFPQRPSGGFTPTGEALQGVVEALTAPTAPKVPGTGEKLIVLATDGEPNGCDALMSLPIQSLLDGQVPVSYGPSEAAVSAAQAKDVDTYVVSLAPQLVRNAQSRQHLQTLANLGKGRERAASPGAELFSPQDPKQLETTLRSLVGAVVSCELSLEGKLVVDQACKGDVRLNGVQLPCNGENGWAVVDPSRIRLQGAACETWKNQAAAAVEATFPCSIVAPLL
jgi:hypothetical protein